MGEVYILYYKEFFKNQTDKLKYRVFHTMQRLLL